MSSNTSNQKAAERHRLAVEFGILIQPFRELRDRTAPPTHEEYRRALAKVQGGDEQWRARVRAFTTFAPDIIFQQEAKDIGRVPMNLCRAINELLEGRPVMASTSLHEVFIANVNSAEARLWELLARVPIDWQPELFPANTPFTSYLRIHDATTHAARRFHYFDRYLKSEFFDLFVRDLSRSVEVRLVTTKSGVDAVRALSDLTSREFTNYQLVQLDPSLFHDRNIRVDDQVFSLGPGVDRAGMALTNFGPADSSRAAHAQLDDLIARATVIHRS